MPSKSDAFIDSTGLYRWNSNNRIPLDHVLESWDVDGVLLERHQEQRNIDNNKNGKTFITFPSLQETFHGIAG